MKSDPSQERGAKERPPNPCFLGLAVSRGTPGRPPASSIVFARSDGIKVVYGHVKDVTVKQGDTVTAGQAVAAVGNNGFGYMPHTHLGAWKGNEPLQIRFDLNAMARLEAARYRK